MDTPAINTKAAANSSKKPAEGQRVKKPNPLMIDALKNMDRSSLFETLLGLIGNSEEAAHDLEGMVLAAESTVESSDTDDPSDTDGSDADSEDVNPRAKKRARNDGPSGSLKKRFEIYDACGETYDILDNPKDACVTHPGVNQHSKTSSPSSNL